jgi:hypothetical protein
MTVALESARNTAELYEACFPDYTPVLVTYGDGNDLNDVHFEAIEYLKVGAKVLSRDEATGEMAFKRVLKFYNNGYKKTCHIHVIGSIIDEQLPIEATLEHPFWVQGKGWVPVRDLKPGDEFLTYDDNPLIVDRVEPAIYPTDVFNLEVEDFNTYFVDFGIWVHNCNNKLKGTEIGQPFTTRVEYPKPEWSPIHKIVTTTLSVTLVTTALSAAQASRAPATNAPRYDVVANPEFTTADFATRDRYRPHASEFPRSGQRPGGYPSASGRVARTSPAGALS